VHAAADEQWSDFHHFWMNGIVKARLIVKVDSNVPPSVPSSPPSEFDIGKRGKPFSIGARITLKFRAPIRGLKHCSLISKERVQTIRHCGQTIRHSVKRFGHYV
jgi:hypothetical protein